MQAIFFCQRTDLLRCFLSIQHHTAVQSQDDIVQNRHLLYQRKMLVHHADSLVNGILWGTKFRFPALIKDLSAVCLINTK